MHYIYSYLILNVNFINVVACEELGKVTVYVFSTLYSY